ncbi:imidazolonepropionase [Motiliproteus sp. SC1-56]|uniref:imidazolonepropionase n=1 Tax=Motiliproteus sp. SC1-56 TaxID=2799565 RepID=UPI001A8D4525|nr:imidazolonepropionase [Motiliproteus sp. SC1-56]
MNTTTTPQLWYNVRIATLDPRVDAPYGLLDDQALVIRDGHIHWLGPAAEQDPARFEGTVVNGGGRLLTPGLIDSHTHLVYGGQRSNEFAARLAGDSYEAIARRGGGILATVNATRELDEAALVQTALPRLRALCAEGATTVEIKSGYGLTVADELKMLRAAKALARQVPVRIRTTLLAAHAVPPEYKGRSDDYVDLICRELIPRVAEEGLAEAVDVFCENIAFDAPQCERLFETARAHGLGIKGHMEQLSNLGGSRLAARFGAWSVDHLEYLDDAAIAAMKEAGTVACLLPGAFYFLGETKLPPVAALREAGVPMALATDCNPGSSPLASLRLMLNMGCVLFGLTPEEALAGVTREGARALGLSEETGMIREGMAADLLLWDLDDPAQLSYEFGPQRLVKRLLAGEETHV